MAATDQERVIIRVDGLVKNTVPEGDLGSVEDFHSQSFDITGLSNLEVLETIRAAGVP